MDGTAFTAVPEESRSKLPPLAKRLALSPDHRFFEL
jgi:hypothetical protein